MKNYCPFCKKVLTLNFLCNQCLETLQQQNPRTNLGICSLYKYEKQLRELILAAKVKNQRRELMVLLELWQSNPVCQNLAENSEFLMPAPASLWSRLRGRIDIPWFLAKNLSLKYNKKLLSPPLRLSWRTKKRAQKKRKGNSFNCSGFIDSKNNKPSILLIDDVVTSGYTLNKICLELEGMYNIKILTLAYSR